jgi:hypothetical protein
MVQKAGKAATQFKVRNRLLETHNQQKQKIENQSITQP